MLKTDVLKKLKESKSYVSGQELCESFGVSRTAVWKAVNQLKSEGYCIDSVTNKGYLLTENADVLTTSEIESRLKTRWLGHPVYCYEEMDSTNSQLRRMADADSGITSGITAITDNQVQGKGRRGRSWQAPAGVNIAMSFLLKPDYSPDVASMLTIIAALAVCEGTDKTIRDWGLASDECQIKWPNDVIINKKKYCGILTEMNVESDYIGYVIVGIGLNVNTESFPEEIEDKATSLYMQLGKKVQRAEIVNNVLCAFEKYHDIFEKEQNLSFILDEYNRRLVSMDKAVRVLDPKGEYSGVSKGINELGELIVEKDNGETINVYAGEVSVRGIYGYV